MRMEIPEANNYAQQLEGLHVVSHVAGVSHGGFGRWERSSEHHGTVAILADFWVLRPRANKSGLCFTPDRQEFPSLSLSDGPQ